MTRSFPGADIGSNHDLVMMTFRDRLMKTKKTTQSRLRFDFKGGTLQATTGGKFAPLINLKDDDLDIESMITTYNTAVTDTASVILRKGQRWKKKPG